MRNTIIWLTTLGLLALALLVGCGGDDSDNGDTLAIIGTYNDGFSDHAVAETTWTMSSDGMADSVFHIASYSNTEQFLVAENDAANEYNPGLWSRFDWAYVGADLYLCQPAYDAASQAAAAAASGADRLDITGTGCGGFPWSKLTPKS